MKNLRQEAILNIIEEHPVSTQEGLVELLRNHGWNVTQATVSRDIKSLGLRKVSVQGLVQYAKPAPSLTPQASEGHFGVFLHSGIVQVTCAQNFVIVKCYAGMANAVCASIDNMCLQGIAGSIAGDDTIFICTMDNETAERISTVIQEAGI